MDKYIKWLPVASLVVAFIASTAISQYQIGEMAEHMKGIQVTQSDIVVNQARIETKLELHGHN